MQAQQDHFLQIREDILTSFQLLCHIIILILVHNVEKTQLNWLQKMNQLN